MGIKILGSFTTTNVPAASSIGIRELAFNATDGRLWTSSDGTNIIEVVTNRGVAFKPATTYAAGDVVSNGGNLWLAVTPAIGVIPGFTAGQWTKFSNTTNVSYDVAVAYGAGDIVIGPDDELYVAPGVVGPEPWTPASWTAVSSKDIGGRAWDSVLATAGEYAAGDIVTNGGNTYVSISGGDTTPGTFDPIDYNIVGDEVWDAGKTYNAGDVVTGSDGKDYVVPDSGVGVPGANNPTGGAPWLPVNNIEKGGVLYSAQHDYVVGDIVAEGGLVYVCIQINAAGTQAPTSAPLFWKIATPESVNTTFDNTIDYKAGDIITIGDDIFIAPIDITAGAAPSAGAPGSWDLATPGEKGGVAYSATLLADAGLAYTLGDIVTQGGITYRALGAETLAGTWNAADWSAIDVAGSAYDNTVVYETGDIVSYLDEIYIVGSAAPFAAGTPPTSTAPAFSDVPPIVAERGGILWAGAVDYLAGDIVSENGNVYTCLNTHTSVAGNVAAGSPFQPSQTNWAASDNSAYDNTITYKEGDTVTVGDDIFIAPVGGVAAGIVPPAAPWLLATPDEVGGIAYDGATAYLAGDIVSDGGVLYIALIDHTGAPAPIAGGNANWNDTSVAGSFIATFTPSGGDEYPNAQANGDVTNDYYIVDGLGAGVTHTMIGTPLNGTVMKDGDKMICGIGFDNEGSVAGSWNYVPGPVIPAEQGGILYSTTTAYSIGDIVGYSDSSYICIQAGTNQQPDTATAYWKNVADDAKEYGGRAWSNTVIYAVGDTVIGTDDVLFRSILGGAGNALPASGVEENTDWSSNTIFDPGTYV